MSAPKSEAAIDAEGALLRYARTKARLEAYRGPIRGAFCEDRMAAWREALADLDRTALAARTARIEAYRAARRARLKTVGELDRETSEG